MRYTEEMKEQIYAWLKDKHIKVNELCLMLNRNPNYLQNCQQNRSIGNDAWIQIVELMNQGKESEEKEMITEETKEKVLDLPFSEADFIVPRKPDIECVMWKSRTEQEEFRIGIYPDLRKRMDARFFRIAEKHGRLYLIPSSKGIDSAFETTEMPNGSLLLQLKDKDDVERLKPYLGKHVCKYEETFEIFYIEKK